MKRTTKRKAPARSRTTSVRRSISASVACSASYNFSGDMDTTAPPAPPSLIDNQFATLKDELGVLEREITGLNQKIDPVLTPIPPSSAGTAGGVGAAAIPASLTSNRLAGLIEFVREQAGRIAALKERVEV